MVSRVFFVAREMGFDGFFFGKEAELWVDGGLHICRLGLVGWLVGWFGFDMIMMEGVEVGSFCVFGLGTNQNMLDAGILL